jgi:hypothetical protein
MGRHLEDAGMHNYFLNRTPITQKIRARVYTWNCIKFKIFCTSKKTIAKIRMGENLKQSSR